MVTSTTLAVNTIATRVALNMRVEVIYFACTKVIGTTYPTETSLITDLNPGAESIPDETLWNGRHGNRLLLSNLRGLQSTRKWLP
ncbi:TPA: hypothetical protein EYO63_25880 [Candidatus Poribacteria bacterium]|nr:hypothetical protein [Candidatus Poribacteria bacterium]